jgi:hypothetical protein
LLKAEALGGWEWIAAGEIAGHNLLLDIIRDATSYRNVMEALRTGELPGGIGDEGLGLPLLARRRPRPAWPSRAGASRILRKRIHSRPEEEGRTRS